MIVDFLCSFGIHDWASWSVHEISRTVNDNAEITNVGIKIRTQCNRCKKVVIENKKLR